MVPMTFIWWIWPYFNFVDFRAYFGPFSLVNRDRQKMADLLRKMASNQKMQENKPTLKFNSTIEKRWGVSIFELFGPQHLSHWALIFINTLSSHKKRRTKGHIAESDIVCDVGEVLWCHQAHFSDTAGHIHYTFKYNLVTHDLGR